MKTFDLKKYLAEGKLLKEFIGGELEKRNNALFSKLVPGSGNAETVEGELLRAINRIVYRWYNDGDKFFEGYGTETAGPAHSYLVNSGSPISSQLDRIFGEIAGSFNDKAYEAGIQRALGIILDYVEKQEAEDSLTPNKEDMFDYNSEFEDEEEDDYGWDDYDDEEDDDYYQ